MGKAEENKKIKRSAILSHAFSLFLSNGIDNTSISDITQNAGVGKGTFYFYFKDKDDLIQKLMAQKGAQLFNHAISELEKKGPLPVEDTVILVVDDLIEQLLKDSKLVRFINKNLTIGIYHKALTSDGLHNLEASNFLDYYYEVIENDSYKYKEPLLMLYTIVELVSSTCHSIILKEEPVKYEEYKPYLFQCIRNIISVFRIED